MIRRLRRALLWLLPPKRVTLVLPPPLPACCEDCPACGCCACCGYDVDCGDCRCPAFDEALEDAEDARAGLEALAEWEADGRRTVPAEQVWTETAL